MGASRRGKSGRTQINRGGAPCGNGNAKKTPAWLESYDLSTPEGVRVFLQEIIKHTWTGQLGTRAASALNGSVRLMLEHELLPELERRIKSLENGRMKTN
ncbi:MAG: hypothetical protein ABSF63_03955 [Candidatus Bathyarchaeia archaeon]|jgi:hypothetical protein